MTYCATARALHLLHVNGSVLTNRNPRLPSLYSSCDNSLGVMWRNITQPALLALPLRLDHSAATLSSET
jgi:hypothetical protein